LGIRGGMFGESFVHPPSHFTTTMAPSVSEIKSTETVVQQLKAQRAVPAVPVIKDEVNAEDPVSHSIVLQSLETR